MTEPSAGLRVTVLRVPAADAELAADRLTQAGAFAVEERPDPPGHVTVRAVLGDSDELDERRLGALPDGWSRSTEVVDPTPLETWREFAAPVWITDDLVLHPAWQFAPEGVDVTAVAVEPGAAFGLGDHPTTRASAAAVWRTIRPGDRLLDVGCGTGVLAIVGLLRGASTAVGTDIAEPAVPVTLANAERNGLSGRVSVSTTPLAEIDGEFDVVVANILAPTLIELSSELVRATAPGGTLIISGVLAGGYDHVLAALAPLEVESVDEVDGWAAVVLRRPGQG